MFSKMALEMIHTMDRSLLCGLGGGDGVREIMGWTRPIFLEKSSGPKENFAMVGGGSLCLL